MAVSLDPKGSVGAASATGCVKTTAVENRIAAAGHLHSTKECFSMQQVFYWYRDTLYNRVTRYLMPSRSLLNTKKHPFRLPPMGTEKGARSLKARQGAGAIVAFAA
ncbi:MAG: hypothetical protein EA401_05545 [Planctomycetota bacterium]|nr:MAG: hypothetical protein EA401_05545 [Planctomycetota bacterium]